MQIRGAVGVLRAAAAGRIDCDPGQLPAPVVEALLHRGLGPVLARITGGRAAATDLLSARIRSADLTARILTAERYDLIGEVLAAASRIGCRVGLLKGTATAIRYYPEPHLRPSGDVDLLVSPEHQGPFERTLYELGFRQTSQQPASAFVGRHHSMPFWHPERQTWIDVHIRLQPPQYPQAAILAPAFVRANLSSLELGGQRAAVMRDELQLVYTSTRWSERLDPARGIFPVLDAALLLRTCGGTLDWEWVLRGVAGTWAATALRLMLSYLQRWQLAPVPREVLATLAATESHTNALTIRLLHRLATRGIVEGRPPRGSGFLWTALLRPASPAMNLLALPYALARHQLAVHDWGRPLANGATSPPRGQGHLTG